MVDIAAKRFTDKIAARKHLEEIRWPDGPVCPHCGALDNASRIKGRSARPGLWFCGDCRKQFTVTVGTLFERSKIPLNKWLLAVHLMSSSSTGMSAQQMHRILGVSYKTAWFMTNRIRESDSLTVQKSSSVQVAAITRFRPARRGGANHTRS